jgi:hypothetical protein
MIRETSYTKSHKLTSPLTTDRLLVKPKAMMDSFGLKIGDVGYKETAFISVMRKWRLCGSGIEVWGCPLAEWVEY